MSQTHESLMQAIELFPHFDVLEEYNNEDIVFFLAANPCLKFTCSHHWHWCPSNCRDSVVYLNGSFFHWLITLKQLQIFSKKIFFSQLWIYYRFSFTHTAQNKKNKKMKKDTNTYINPNWYWDTYPIAKKYQE